MSYEIHNADCLDAMRQMADNSVDTIVTDPPYGLAFMGAKWDDYSGAGSGNDVVAERQTESELYAQTHKGAPHYGCSHKCAAPKDGEMRRFQESMTPIFAEALRVAKPGAHLLAFGGSRTYHRMACAIEDAGWEIRDCIMWVYGSGFPKSMDVSKAIDKKLGAKRTEVLGLKNQSDIRGGALMETQGKPRLDIPITAPASDEAKKWNGYGTCLKPAYEPIIVARKPLDGTVAANVLKWGTGALNIDGCRVATFSKGPGTTPKSSVEGRRNSMAGAMDRTAYDGSKGRFPANLVHDGSEEVLACFPDSKGQCGAVKGDEPSELTRGIYGKFSGNRPQCAPRGDSGSAARFFYCAKASRKERGERNHHCTVKPLALMRWLITLVAPPNAVLLDPFMGSGTTGVAALQLNRRFIGIEREAEYYEIAKRRLDGTALPLFNTTERN